MRAILLPALRVTFVTWLLCGIVYPLAVTGLGQWLLPDQANGSLLRTTDGTVIGSQLIGQDWTGPRWFHGRPSATTAADANDPTKTRHAPYNGAASGASNLGPTSRILAERLAADRKAVESAQPELVGRRLPSDMLTTSASGLDPDISPAYALLQAPRVAAARGVPASQIAALIATHTIGRLLGVFGEPRVNVLRLNLELENAFRGRSEEKRVSMTVPVEIRASAWRPRALPTGAPVDADGTLQRPWWDDGCKAGTVDGFDVILVCARDDVGAKSSAHRFKRGPDIAAAVGSSARSFCLGTSERHEKW